MQFTGVEGEGQAGGFISADDKGEVIEFTLNKKTQKYEENSRFKFKVGDNTKVKSYDINIKEKIIAAGMSDGCIELCRFDGYQIFKSRNTKAAILSINYIFGKNEIRAFSADSENLVYTDIKKSEATIPLRSNDIFTEDGREINRTYLKKIISNVDPENYTTYITKQGISLQALCLLANMDEEF